MYDMNMWDDDFMEDLPWQQCVLKLKCCCGSLIIYKCKCHRLTLQPQWMTAKRWSKLKANFVKGCFNSSGQILCTICGIYNSMQVWVSVE